MNTKKPDDGPIDSRVPNISLTPAGEDLYRHVQAADELNEELAGLRSRQEDLRASGRIKEANELENRIQVVEDALFDFDI